MRFDHSPGHFLLLLPDDHVMVCGAVDSNIRIVLSAQIGLQEASSVVLVML